MKIPTESDQTANRTEVLSSAANGKLILSIRGHKVMLDADLASERDLVDQGSRGLVDALGYSGAARFLRHFSKGNSDYLEIQEKLFKGMRLDQIPQRFARKSRTRATNTSSGFGFSLILLLPVASRLMPIRCTITALLRQHDHDSVPITSTITVFPTCHYESEVSGGI